MHDAVSKGAKLQTGSKRICNKGLLLEPTVVTDVPKNARAMSREPFGPMATISPFSKFDDAAEEATVCRTVFASYAFTSSTKTATAIGAAIESGMVAINSVGLALSETPFGSVKDSGYGSEGGTETMERNTKFITQTGVPSPCCRDFARGVAMSRLLVLLSENQALLTYPGFAFEAVTKSSSPKCT